MTAVTGLLALALLAAEGTPSSSDSMPRESWALTLSEAIRTGLGNSEIVRITCERVEEDDQVYVTIAPRDPTGSPSRFRAETMALVRAIEQSYWGLAQERAELEARAQAVKTCRAIFERALGERRGRGSVADLADAETYLGEFQANLAAKRTDVSNAEMRLRKVMGLGRSDHRPIVPVTPPVETERKADWETCLATMSTSQPDLVEQQRAVSASGLRYLVACGPAFLLANVAPLAADADAPNGTVAQAHSALRQEQTALERVLHRTTHNLARFFVDADANYQQLSAATRLRRAAVKRVEVQKTFYEEGRIPLERYCKAISQDASAAAQEARFRCAYNVSLMALEEAKGTLLAYRQVTVENAAPAEVPQSPVVSSPAPRSLDQDVVQTGAEAAAPGRSVNFDITIGERQPVRIRGTISITPGQ